MLRIPVVTLILLASALPATGQEATLPIRRVVLYKHGIGYFERQGPVEGTQDVALHFQTPEMGDVLKTLTVLDRDGGRIGAIAYDSQKSPERQLSEFSFSLDSDDIQQSLLRQLRGARVHVDVSGYGEVSGAVLGLDHRARVVNGEAVRNPVISLLTDAAEMVSADLGDLRSLRFEDQELAGEIQRYLQVLRSGHQRDRKSVRLRCEGDGERRVFVSYAVEQPVWKASYRLVLEGDERSPFLQGWAVVDNTSDEDWDGVTLSLVAGMPISFRQDLYTPQFRERPELVLDEKALESVDKWADSASKRKNAAPEERAKARLGFAMAQRPDRQEGRHQAAESITREIGDLLEYQIEHPVTIPRNRSALLPIVSESIEGGKVALYDERARSNHPMAAVRLHNTTGLTLEGGPVTVLEQETYAGESLLDSIKPDEKRYVPYAVDLGLHATTGFDTSSERVFKVTILQGQILTHYSQVEKKTYSFDNRNTDPRTVVIEHPRRNGYRLVEPQQASEEELDLLRFEVEVPAQQNNSLTVVESRDLDRSYQIENLDGDTVALLSKQRILNQQAEEMLRQVIAARGAIGALNRELEGRRQRLSEIDTNQERIRKNLTALGSSAEEKDLRRSYVDQLQQDEDAVTRLRGEADRLQEQVRGEQAALERKITGFALEYLVR